MDLSSDSTLRMSVYAVQPTVTGTGIEVRFMAEGSNGAWYSSANTVVPIGTRTMLTWNMSGVPRAPLKQIRVCWQFTTSAKSWGNVLYVDAVEAS